MQQYRLSVSPETDKKMKKNKRRKIEFNNLQNDN